MGEKKMAGDGGGVVWRFCVGTIRVIRGRLERDSDRLQGLHILRGDCGALEFVVDGASACGYWPRPSLGLWEVLRGEGQSPGEVGASRRTLR